MKKIGIIFAMEEEINAFKEHIHIDKEESIFDLHLYEGTFNNNQCIFTEVELEKLTLQELVKY